MVGYFFYEFFYNNKWFEYNKNNLNLNMFWRTKPIILKLIIYRKTLKVNNIRTRICHLNVFSSKIQIFRYEDTVSTTQRQMHYDFNRWRFIYSYVI